MGDRTSRKPGYIAVIPADVRYDTVLAPNAKLLYGEITALAGADGYCWATNDYFSRLYGLNKRTITRLVGQLQERGHIRVEVTRKNEGSGVVDQRKIYIGRQLAQAAAGIDKNVYTPGQKCLYPLDKNVGDYKGELTSINNTPLTPQGETEMLFDRFWAAYPRKVGKKRAQQAWKKLAPDMSLCRVMSKALAKQKQSGDWTRENGRFIPHPATWINGRRWEDDLPGETPEAPRPRRFVGTKIIDGEECDIYE